MPILICGVVAVGGKDKSTHYTESRCRGGYVKAGDVFIVDDLCPPICHELWNSIYPLVYALKNEAILDYGITRAKCFDAMCPDECRVHVHGETIEE